MRLALLDLSTDYNRSRQPPCSLPSRVLLPRGMSTPLHAPGGFFFRCESPFRRVSVSFGVACALMAGVVGCQSNAAKVAPAEPPAVPVSQPVQREVTDYVEFTGQTKAVYSE